MHFGKDCAKWHYIQTLLSHLLAPLSATPLNDTETFFTGYLWHREETLLPSCSCGSQVRHCGRPGAGCQLKGKSFYQVRWVT